MKLLLDQGLPRSSAAILREAGFDAVHAGEISLATAEDELILQRGRSEGRIVITLDADFHALMALSSATSPSVIRLRIEGLKAERLAELLQLVLRQCAEDLEAGALVTVPAGPWRLKRLPVR